MIFWCKVNFFSSSFFLSFSVAHYIVDHTIAFFLYFLYYINVLFFFTGNCIIFLVSCFFFVSCLIIHSQVQIRGRCVCSPVRGLITVNLPPSSPSPSYDEQQVSNASLFLPNLVRVEIILLILYAGGENLLSLSLSLSLFYLFIQGVSLPFLHLTLISSLFPP